MFESSLNPSTGGVQRVSWLLASHLKSCGHNVFFSYKVARLDYDKIPENEKFFYSGDCKIDEGKAFYDFILNNKIGIIINQNQFTPKAISLFSYLKQYNVNIPIYSVFHNTPKHRQLGVNPIIYNFKEFIKHCLRKEDYKTTVKQTCYLSDYIVLLSEKYIEEFVGYFKIDRKDHYCPVKVD